MLLPILLAASFLPLLPQQASMQCVDVGAEIANSQTQPASGPRGTIAVLKVSTADDHDKNTHLCRAEYELLITPAGAATARVVELLATDGDWERTISLRLNGFALDGSQVFGVLTEGGKYPSTTLFNYDTVGGKVQLIDLKKQFAQIVTARCNTTFDIVGPTETTAIVIKLNSAKPCASDGLWVLDPKVNSVHRLQQGTSFQTLFNKAYSGALFPP
jgi:hypothetical protein